MNKIKTNEVVRTKSALNQQNCLVGAYCGHAILTVKIGVQKVKITVRDHVMALGLDHQRIAQLKRKIMEEVKKIKEVAKRIKVVVKIRVVEVERIRVVEVAERKRCRRSSRTRS